MRLQKLVPLVCVLVGLFVNLGLPREALANGRFPRAQTILAAPGSDGSVLYLRATFGLLVSRDGGKTFRWICEQAMGFSGTWDPPVAVTKGGRIWVGLEKGLSYSDDGCKFTRVPELEGSAVRDLTTDAKGEEVVAVTSTPRQFTYVWRKRKSGKFEKMGTGIDGVVALTVEVAPSKPERVYVTVQSESLPDGRLFRSDDGGVRLTEQRITLPTDPGEEPGRLFVSAVDPTDPDRLVLRRLSNKGSDIFVSTDGGNSLHRTHRMTSAMFGFSKGPNASTFYIASGLPEHGILKSTDRGEHFTKIADFGALCVFSIGAKLFACNNELSGPVLSLSSNDGKSFTPVAAWKDVLGPTCDAGTCDKPWAEMEPVLNPERSDGGSEAPALPAPSSAPSGSASSPAGSSGGADGGSKSTPPKGACGCVTPGESTRIPWDFGGIGPLALGVLALIRRLKRDPG